ncbi:hypothetical protein BDM02DRAFT_2989282 [Thelephora ganbajun]|uniref:Uncharacterized protein n=1 Tax=Thelephora ganbajun TaxID=370292 RepID=A0ACB6ZBA1_THEGA|nr:hypothetical protein BDM02DRAFT_2989282 [Thelephora ganbajun]
MDRLLNRLFDKKPKKLPKPSPKHISLGISPNVSAGLFRSREELDIGPDDERSNKGSRIVFQDDSGEDKELPAPEALTSGVAVGGTEHGSDSTRENPTDTREGEGGGRPAETSKVPEREYENTTLTSTTILSVPKEAPHESSPLEPLRAALRTLATVHANHQEAIAIGNKTEVLLSRIVALEERFDSCPDGVEELRRRDRLIRYAGIMHSDLALSPF